MKKNYRHVLLFLFLIAIAPFTQAQIATGYEVGTWYQFKTAAVSYTFDDNCSNQIPKALPIFDQYKFKTTFFVVTNWSPNWTEYKKLSANGHEIASHTVTHPQSLAAQNASTQEGEYSQSQSTINNNITDAKCVTIAYPNCTAGTESILQKYFIAGRTCAGSIVPSSPSNFFSLSSIICGAESQSDKNAAAWNSRVQSAASSKGWCVFLFHGIDGDGGYSNASSSDIRTHVEYVNSNASIYWVGTFRNVVKYIKERNAAKITETAITSDSLQFTLTDGLDNAIYNVPVSVRRVLPSGWNTAKVYINKQLVTSTITEVTGRKYIVFEALPDQPNNAITNGNPVTGVTDASESNAIVVEPNPFTQETIVEFPGSFSYAIHSTAGKEIVAGTAENFAHVGNNLESGVYIIRISKGDQVYTKRLVKK